jgi:predicted peroxiredoxin
LVDYKEKVELTAVQKKAFSALKTAFKKCKSSGIEFAMQEDSLIALNGRNVLSIEESDINDQDNEFDLQDFICDGLDTGLCPYIDCSVTVTVKK